MGRSSRRLLILFAALGLAATTRALGPHEVALLVNANDPASREVANHYVKLRSIPLQNVIHLDLPADFGGSNAVVSLDEFRRLIYQPATAALHERHLDDHMLAWVYSAGFPTTVQADSPLSIHAVTFEKGAAIGAEDAKGARKASPLFRGPGAANGPQGDPVSLEQFAMSLRTNMPLPAMSLGYTGARGMSAREVVDGLRFSVRSDGSRPEGYVNFVLSPDVRSTCRAWQVPGTVAELGRMGIRTVITTNHPEHAKSLIGLQIGMANLDAPLDVKLLPGSMAEHLTSFGALFHHPEQSKITEWMRAGAAGSAGTVTEPFALWPKFPHARFFVHYAAGCTLLESFYASIAAPAQTYLLGDPLARPFAGGRPLTLICLADDDTAIAGPAEFVATENIGTEVQGQTLLFFLDGRVFLTDGNRAKVTVDTRQLDDGWHELRVVGYTGGNVRNQAFARKLFGVNNRGHTVKMAAPTGGATVRSGEPVECRIEALGTPVEYELFAQGRKLAVSTNAVFNVDLASAGPGPVSLQAWARYEQGKAASRPIMVEIAPAAQ